MLQCAPVSNSYSYCSLQYQECSNSVAPMLHTTTLSNGLTDTFYTVQGLHILAQTWYMRYDIFIFQHSMVIHQCCVPINSSLCFTLGPGYKCKAVISSPVLSSVWMITWLVVDLMWPNKWVKTDYFDRVRSWMVGKSILSKWSTLINMQELSIMNLPLSHSCSKNVKITNALLSRICRAANLN